MRGGARSNEGTGARRKALAPLEEALMPKGALSTIAHETIASASSAAPRQSPGNDLAEWDARRAENNPGVSDEMCVRDVCNALKAYNIKHGLDLVGREVTMRHSSPCHECGECDGLVPGVHTGPREARIYGCPTTRYMYFTSASNPRGAKKWCGECMAQVMGGAIIPCSEEDMSGGDY